MHALGGVAAREAQSLITFINRLRSESNQTVRGMYCQKCTLVLNGMKAKPSKSCAMWALLLGMRCQWQTGFPLMLQKHIHGHLVMVPLPVVNVTLEVY